MVSFWRKKHVKDVYYRRAKQVGYRSRASFKLLEMQRSFHVFTSGDIVLDLGAAPGGWLQVAAEAVGVNGLVVGVDLAEIRPLPLSNVLTIRGDITDTTLHDKLARVLPRRVDILLADLSPKVSGVWETDHARQLYLAQQAVALGASTLKPGGGCVLKLFQGRGTDEFLHGVARDFASVKLFKPKASRSSSAEIYMIGRGFRASQARKSSRQDAEAIVHEDE